MSRKLDNSVDARKSPVEVYLNTSMKSGDIFLSGEEDKTVDSAKFMVLQEYMTLKGKKDDRRVYSNLVPMRVKPKVYEVKGAAGYGYSRVNWSEMSKDAKNAFKETTGASHCTILIVNIGGKIGQLTLKGSSSKSYFDFKNELKSKDIGDPSAEDIYVLMANSGKTISTSFGESRVPSFSWSEAGTDDIEITEDLYQVQKAHYESMGFIEETIDSATGDTKAEEGAEYEAKGSNEDVSREEVNTKLLFDATEDLSFCHKKEDILRDWNRFYPKKYKTYDKPTRVAVIKMWADKYVSKGGEMNEILPL